MITPKSLSNGDFGVFRFLVSVNNGKPGEKCTKSPNF